MSFVDKSNHPRYEPNEVYTTKEHPTKKDMPYELEHVYDITRRGYVTNNRMCCYYSPSHHHEQCKHRKDCLFRRSTIWSSFMEFQRDKQYPELHGLIDEIWIVKNRINDLKEIINDYTNGVITYHSFIEDAYNIQITRNNDGVLVTSVGVKANFKERVRTGIRRSEIELRDLKRELYRRRRLMKK